MEFVGTSIPGVILIKPKVFIDKRGFFFETYQAKVFAAAGITATLVQENQSGSGQGTLRGLHYQIKHAQGKLVRVVVGEVFDVAVDMRLSSATFSKWVGTYLSSENKNQVWIPPGFAHGFYVLSDWAEFLYKVSDFYAPQWERTLIWNDPDVGIEWPLVNNQDPFLSTNDALGLPLKQSEFFK
ncbi:MAG: dTDP-4-dehydrorhamnose 3,5-epimerase [Anaerolineales bacterium]